MLMKLFVLYRRTLQLTVLQMIFCFVLFLGCAIFTILLGVAMMVMGHCCYEEVLLICFIPWLVLMLILAIFLVVYQYRTERIQKQLMVEVPSHLIWQVTMLGIKYVLSTIRGATKE